MASLALIAGLVKGFWPDRLLLSSSWPRSRCCPAMIGDQALAGDAAGARPPWRGPLGHARHVRGLARPGDRAQSYGARAVFGMRRRRWSASSLRCAKAGASPSGVIRTTEFLDAVAAAPGAGARRCIVTYAERVPVGRRMTVTVAPLMRLQRARRQHPGAAPRPHRGRAHQPDAC